MKVTDFGEVIGGYATGMGLQGKGKVKAMSKPDINELLDKALEDANNGMNPAEALKPVLAHYSQDEIQVALEARQNEDQPAQSKPKEAPKAPVVKKTVATPAPQVPKTAYQKAQDEIRARLDNAKPPTEELPGIVERTETILKKYTPVRSSKGNKPN